MHNDKSTKNDCHSKKNFHVSHYGRKRDRTASLQSNSTRIVSRSFFEQVDLIFPIINFKRLVEYEESIMGLGENEQSETKLRAKRRLFLLTIME